MGRPSCITTAATSALRPGSQACSDALQDHTVPLFFGQGELAVGLQLDGVVSPHPDILILLDVGPLDPQLAGLGVEVDWPPHRE